MPPARVSIEARRRYYVAAPPFHDCTACKAAITFQLALPAFLLPRFSVTMALHTGFLLHYIL